MLSKQVNSHLNLEEAEFFGLQIASDDKDINEVKKISKNNFFFQPFWHDNLFTELFPEFFM